MPISNFDSLLISSHQNLEDKDLIEIALSQSCLKGDIKDKLLHWDFGPIMEMKYMSDAQNYLFSDEIVPLHWDGAFYKEPSLLMFYCTESFGTGGETVFSNTELVWESMSADEKEMAQSISLKYKTEKKAHYGGEINLPLVQAHPVSGRNILRLAEKVETTLNPVSLDMSSTLGIDLDAFYQLLVEKFYAEENLYTHRWKIGDLIIVDNYTFLHGRRALANNLSRSFKRIQIL